MTTAIYAFSGDPITYGHINIIERACRSFDKVIVAIGENPDKKYTFSLKEREDMAKKTFLEHPQISVTSFTGLLIDYAYEQGASVIIKGVRNLADFDYENILHQVGESQKLDIETHILFADPSLAHISSSAVKAILKHSGDIHEYVPLHVKQKLEEELLGQYIIGVTGVIGSGKSYISNLLTSYAFGEREIHNIELDHIGHDILSKLKEPAYRQIRYDIENLFNKTVMQKDGFIDRKALGDIVFSNHKKLEKLNKIMEKAILVKLRKELAKKNGIILINCALLAEAGMLHICNNNIIIITVNKEIQESRLMDRGYTDHQRNKRVFSQYDEDSKTKAIIKNIKEHKHGRLWTINNNKINLSDLYIKFKGILKELDMS